MAKSTNISVNMPPLNARLYEVINHYSRGNVTQFASTLEDVSQQRLSRIFKVDPRSKEEPRFPSVPGEVLEQVARTYGDVNVEWLLSGRGGMFTNNSVKPYKEPDNSIIKVSNAVVEYAEAATISIPLSYIEVAANPEVYEDDRWLQSPEHITVPTRFLSDPEGKYIAVQYTRHNMRPTVYSGDTLIIRLLPRERWDEIREQYVYVIGHLNPSGIGEAATYRIKNRLSNGDFINIMSDNLDKDSFYSDLIKREKLLSVWYVEGKISFQLRNINADLADRVDVLERQMEKINRGDEYKLKEGQ